MQRLFFGLVNGSFGDPGVYLELAGEGTLLDCGDLHALPAPRIHRVRELCVSHAHVDHLFGFDWLFRLSLGATRRLRIFGPPGIADRIAAKIEGYTWNITLDFTFQAEVTELFLEERRGLVSELSLRNGLEKRVRVREAALGADGTFLDERRRRLRAVAVDHGTPCLAYSYEQKRGVRVSGEAIDRLGLERGPWIQELKQAVLEGRWDDRARAIAEVVPGAKVAYVTDTLRTPEVHARVVDLARGATVLACEAKFMERDRPKADLARHLTASDAGLIARDARVESLVLFHPSPRYEAAYDDVLAEAQARFPAARFQPEHAIDLLPASERHA